MTKQAELDLNKKLRMERGLFLSIRAIFFEMAKASTNPEFSSQQYENNFRDVLADHYIGVMNGFIGQYRNANGVSMDSIQETMLIRNSIELVEDRAIDQAKIITDTNIRQKKSVQKIISNFTINSNDLNSVKQDIYLGLLMRRVNSIACVETQWSAETAKFSEIIYLTHQTGIAIKAVGDTTKRWDAQGDDLMRRWHSDADSQVKPINEPFIVKSEKLMRPGDTSLGATASNIINCRCSSFYGVDEITLTFVERPINKIISFGLTKKKPILSNDNLQGNFAGLTIKAKRLDVSVDSVKKASFSDNEIAALDKYKESSYQDILFFQRTRSRKILNAEFSAAQQIEMKRDIQLISSSIEKSVLTEDVVLYRGMNSHGIIGDNIKKLSVGDSMPISSFQSTSVSKEVAEEFAEKFAGITDSILFEISVPKGSNALFVDDAIKQKLGAKGLAKEHEVILGGFGEYKVTGIERIGNRTNVKMIYEGHNVKSVDTKSITNNTKRYSLDNPSGSRILVSELEFSIMTEKLTVNN